MVFVFELKEWSALCYQGKDKYENDQLLQFSNKDDIWFHVEGLSSAHVYLHGFEFEAVPQDLATRLSIITKANSISGSKERSALKVQYTPVSNLNKTKGMDAGTVTFKNNKKVKRVTLTGAECSKQTQNTVMKEVSEVQQVLTVDQFRTMLRDKRPPTREEYVKPAIKVDGYAELMVSENMQSNLDAKDLEEDFM